MNWLSFIIGFVAGFVVVKVSFWLYFRRQAQNFMKEEAEQ